MGYASAVQRIFARDVSDAVKLSVRFLHRDQLPLNDEQVKSLEGAVRKAIRDHYAPSQALENGLMRHTVVANASPLRISETMAGKKSLAEVQVLTRLRTATGNGAYEGFARVDVRDPNHPEVLSFGDGYTSNYHGVNILKPHGT